MTVVVLSSTAGPEAVEAAVSHLRAHGLTVQVSRGSERTILLVLDGTDEAILGALVDVPGVDHVQTLSRPYRLAAREIRPEGTMVSIGGLVVGGGTPVIVAGSDSPFGHALDREFALGLKQAGAGVLRAGVYRPPSLLYASPQIDAEALSRLTDLGHSLNLPIAVAPLSAEDVPLLARSADVLVIRAEEMGNRALLQACGYAERPVVLARGVSTLLDEWLHTADELLGRGNRQLILAAGGIRTYETEIRATLDLSAVPLVKRRSHLPVMADLSGLGAPAGVLESLALSAVAAGADGLLLDVREEPSEELGALGLTEFTSLLKKVQPLVAALRQ